MIVLSAKYIRTPILSGGADRWCLMVTYRVGNCAPVTMLVCADAC